MNLFKETASPVSINRAGLRPIAMSKSIVFSVLNAKYVHASPAPWCLAAGVKLYAPSFYSYIHIVEGTINEPAAQVLDRIVACDPAVVGFSCYIWNIRETLCLCAALKQLLPGLILILGGPEVSYCAASVLQKNPQIDFVLKGEGEEAVPRFIKALFSGDNGLLQFPTDCKSIPGVCGRNTDGTVYETEAVPLASPPPSALCAGYADALHGRIAYLETSRGCPYACAFCLSGRNDPLRVFSLDAAFSDLLTLANADTKTIKFVDRTFNADINRCNKILSYILLNYGTRIPKGICFHFEIAGDILREDTFGLLQQMPRGAIQLEIGMQSFCEKTLEAIHRKTNTGLLQKNIRRLTDMGNMHIHIDLIAGLPYEDFSTFADSFQKGYALHAQMLQLGFLKLLHGSVMRNQPDRYPCAFDSHPPYEVSSTPWLSHAELTQIHDAEDALDRAYNSGRFHLTLAYVLEASGCSPFTFYLQLGVASRNAGVCRSTSLDAYTAILQEYCNSLPNVDAVLLRDLLIKDRLCTNSSRPLPPCLFRQDSRLAKVTQWLSKQPATAAPKGIRRNVALLYASNTVCWVDYVPEDRNPVTGRWTLSQASLENLVF